MKHLICLILLAGTLVSAGERTNWKGVESEVGDFGAVAFYKVAKIRKTDKGGLSYEYMRT